MKTKAVYVVVSDDTDFYLEQAVISITSLKRTNPTMSVYVIVDGKTKTSLIGGRSRLFEVADKVVEVDCPAEMSKQQCSRQLKTTVREIVEGDYLFIDTDTVITGDLSAIDGFECEIGAVKDKHLALSMHPMATSIGRWASYIGWECDLSTDNYFNSGVMYVKDTPDTHRFYKRWNEEWKHSVSRGINLDQPALGKVDNELRLISEIDGPWNCQVTDNGLKYLYDAKIIHYFASMQKWDTPEEITYYFRKPEIFERLRKNGLKIDETSLLQIEQAKSAFNSRIMVMSGKNIDLQNSRLFRALRKCYFNHPSIFGKCERLVNFFFKD